MTVHRQIKTQEKETMTTELKPINATIKVDDEKKMIHVYSQMVWDTVKESKEIKGHKVETIADDSMRTVDAYLVVPHFTKHEATRQEKEKARKTTKEVKEAKPGETKEVKIREARIQEVVSADSYITVKGENATFKLVEIPTAILDVALLIRDGNKGIMVDVANERKAYFLAYVRSYATNKVKSYTRNCGIAGAVNVDKAIATILATVK